MANIQSMVNDSINSYEQKRWEAALHLYGIQKRVLALSPSFHERFPFGKQRALEEIEKLEKEYPQLKGM